MTAIIDEKQTTIEQLDTRERIRRCASIVAKLYTRWRSGKAEGPTTSELNEIQAIADSFGLKIDILKHAQQVFAAMKALEEPYEAGEDPSACWQLFVDNAPDVTKLVIKDPKSTWDSLQFFLPVRQSKLEKREWIKNLFLEIVRHKHLLLKDEVQND